MFEDDLGDERGPLPPEDRLWRHPSEVGASRRAALAAESERPKGNRSMLAVAVVAGLTGAAVAVTALALTGSLSPRVIERQSVVTSAQLASATTTLPTPKTGPDLVQEAAAAVAGIHVLAGSSKRSGSAVVLRSDGVLLTSDELVRGADEAKVVLSDGRQVVGTVTGRDPGTGLAVLKVPVDDLTPLTRSTDAPKPGDPAISVAGRSGPDADPSVSAGVISSLDRSVRGTHLALWGLLQTDHPVPANADGGALVGPDGDVMGITLHLSAGGDMGYSVPIDVAWLVGQDLFEHGRVRAAWLGVEKGADLSEATAEQLGVDGGARVTAVAEGSPGSAAGLQVDDVIIRLGTNTVRTMSDLRGAMLSHRPGERLTLLVVRDGHRTTVTVTLAEKR